MLGLGILVLLASSLKFVTAHWDTYSPFWKYFVLIAYTAVTYGLAEVGFHRLMLRRTGTGLHALTLCLLPMTFLALRWVAPGSPEDTAGVLHDVGLASLLVINLGFTAFASRRILRTLLRGVLPTYWIAYLILCIGGALVPALPASIGTIAALVLWSVMTIGVVKVNRHVFWLVEEERWPRIFAFFPTVLLAIQFLTLFGLNVAPHLSMPWYGLGLVLVAIPVLLTADAAARVFQQRTGALVFPWPAQIMLPFVIGLITCVAGLAFALSDLPRPVALVPTAALCAVCFATVARRTGHRAFSWAMFLCALMAYQFLPVYFQIFTRQVIQSSAEMVHEQRLPYAFYAITYAPFIIGLISAEQKLKAELFAAPCRQLAIALATVMLVASWTNPKAVFLSGSVLILLWGLMQLVYRHAGCQWGLGLTWLSTCWGLEVFLHEIASWSLPNNFSSFAMIFGAAVLELVHRRVTRSETSVLLFSPYEVLSFSTAGILTARWIEDYGLAISTSGTTVLVPILMLLVLHQRRRMYPVLGEMLLLLSGCAALRYGLAIGLSTPMLSLISVIVLVTSWALARSISPETQSRTLQVFQGPMLRVTTGSLAVAQVVVIGAMPIMSNDHLTPVTATAIALITLWSFISAGRLLPTGWVHAGCLSVMIIVARAMFLPFDASTAWDWLPVAWGVATILGGNIARRVTWQSTDPLTRRVAQHVQGFATNAQLGMAWGTLLILTWPARLAAGLMLIRLAVQARRKPNSWLTHAVVELSFLQFLIGLLSNVATVNLLVHIPSQTWAEVQVTGTFLAAVWWMVLGTGAVRRYFPNDDLRTAELDLWGTAVALSTLSFVVTQSAPLSGLEAVGLTGLFAVVVAVQFRSGIRSQNVGAVWTGLLFGAIGVGYLVGFQVLPAFHIATLFVGLLIGALMSATAKRCPASSKYFVFTGPFNTVGVGLPGVIAVMCIARSLLHAPVTWIGLHSLIILAAAMCYFIRWLESRDRMSLVIATMIFNASQILLWQDLSWSDPQLYLMPLGLSLIALVEGLSRELPNDIKTGLRYAGALVILVSPLFHILDGGWLPLLTLMATSLGISVLSLGLKSRPLLYCGTAFLVADLAALVVRGSLERADVLWIVGIALGSSVVALAAYCENHREIVLQRVRMLSATLQTWA